MKSLMIKDLSRSEELDHSAMAGVRGGHGKGHAPYAIGFLDASKDSFSFDAEQLMLQEQKSLVNNGVNMAFADHVTANVTTKQNGENNINFY